jgi:hypothetical protein
MEELYDKAVASLVHNRVCWCLRPGCLRLAVVTGIHLRSGHSTMCDHCGNRAARKHGHVMDGKQSPTYNSWKNAKQRCHLQKATGFKYYGARDVQMCERWRDSFENFLADMGPRPERTTLGRLNDEGDYEPGNALWQTAEAQGSTRVGN